MTLWLWIAAVLAIWQTPTISSLANAWLGVDWEAQHVFLFAGLLSGLSLGSSQSAGRALVGLLTPNGKSAEFFGFWNAVSKLAAIFGILGLGLLQSVFGLQTAILFCLVLYAMAIVFGLQVHEARGVEVAHRWRQARAN